MAEGTQDLITFDGGALVCDMLLDASATHTLELTQYPIEDGSTISDHAVRTPDTLQLTLVQTETPISPEAGFSVVANQIPYQTHANAKQSVELNVAQPRTQANVNALIGGVTSRIIGAGSTLRIEGLKTDEPAATKTLSIQALTANAPVERVNAFYATLLDLWDSVTPLVITVKGRSYIDMVLTTVTRTDTSGQFGASRFTVTLQRVRTVITQTVELPPVPQATKKVSRGGKPPKPATAEETESMLSKTGAPDAIVRAARTAASAVFN